MFSILSTVLCCTFFITFSFKYIQLQKKIKSLQETNKDSDIFASIIQQANESIVITSAEINAPEPKIIFVNSAFTQLTGYTAEEAIGKSPRILQGAKTDRTVLERLRQNLKHGESFSGEIINYTKDGTEFYMEWEIAPIRNDLKQITHFFATQRNITERKQAEQVLQQALNKLEDLNQLKDDFLSTISHELRTPVTNMKMAIRMLKLYVDREPRSGTYIPIPKDEKVNQYLRVLEDECQREANLINDLLDLQRLEAKLLPSCPEAIEVHIWLPALVQPFEQRIHERQQRLQLSVSQQLATLVSDRSSLERILRELMNNACKYTPRGGIIKVTAETKSSMILLQVVNSGVEIAPTEITKIFDKFYRIPRVDCWQEGGTGLGLALVKQLTESLGGTLEVVSANNQTSFTVSFPLISLCSMPLI